MSLKLGTAKRKGTPKKHESDKHPRVGVVASAVSNVDKHAPSKEPSNSPTKKTSADKTKPMESSTSKNDSKLETDAKEKLGSKPQLRSKRKSPGFKSHQALNEASPSKKKRPWMSGSKSPVSHRSPETNWKMKLRSPGKLGIKVARRGKASASKGKVSPRPLSAHKTPTKLMSPRRTPQKESLSPRGRHSKSPARHMSPRLKSTPTGKSPKLASGVEGQSETESDGLAFLKQQLTFLNEGSKGLKTALDSAKKSPSPKKRYSAVTPVKRKLDESMEEATCKSTPKKRTPKKASKTKRPTSPKASTSKDADGDEGNNVGDVEDENDEDEWADVSTNSDEELSIGSPDPDGLKIVSDDEFETSLEEKAKRNNLTAFNVKSILRQVLTNEHVIALLRNTMDEEEKSEAVYEPKMTRSKIKEVMEKGNIPHPWPISPIKKATKDVPQFLEMPFEEDEEEDEEYIPREEENENDSGDDSESIVSSHVSDFGSPRPQTPSTPKSTTQSISGTPKTPHTEGATTPSQDSMLMRPPVVPPKMKSLNSVSANEADADDEATIAYRTRSKLPLTDTPLDIIESNFVAPDITPDMYDTTCDDAEWKGFLASLYKDDTNLNDSVNDEEDADPEYNFLAEEDELDEEDFRTDKAVKVSKKELNELLDELCEAYGTGDEDEVLGAPKVSLGNVAVATTIAKTTHVQQREKDKVTLPPIPVFTAEERVQLEDQMRKHVQLLSQLYVLMVSDETLLSFAMACKTWLYELDKFKTRSPIGEMSSFNACNLQSALQMVESGDIKFEARKKKVLKKERGKRFFGPPALTNTQMEVIAAWPVFQYPELLPSKGMLPPDVNQNQKVTFTEAEDNLLALGLYQFRHLQRFSDYIQTYILPTKSSAQIRMRMKNMCATKSGDNIIKAVKLENQEPIFPRYLEPFDGTVLKAPAQQEDSKLPMWLMDLKYKESLTNAKLRAIFGLSPVETDSTEGETSPCAVKVASKKSQKRKSPAKAKSDKVPPSPQVQAEMTPPKQPPSQHNSPVVLQNTGVHSNASTTPTPIVLMGNQPVCSPIAVSSASPMTITSQAMSPLVAGAGIPIQTVSPLPVLVQTRQGALSQITPKPVILNIGTGAPSQSITERGTPTLSTIVPVIDNVTSQQSSSVTLNTTGNLDVPKDHTVEVDENVSRFGFVPIQNSNQASPSLKGAADTQQTVVHVPVTSQDNSTSMASQSAKSVPEKRIGRRIAHIVDHEAPSNTFIPIEKISSKSPTLTEKQRNSPILRNSPKTFRHLQDITQTKSQSPLTISSGTSSKTGHSEIGATISLPETESAVNAATLNKDQSQNNSARQIPSDIGTTISIPDSDTLCDNVDFSQLHNTSPEKLNTSKSLDTPTKSAVDIIGDVAQYLLTPEKENVSKSRDQLFQSNTKTLMTPKLTTPPSYRLLAPKTPDKTPVKSSPFLPKKSPRRKILQRQVKSVLPKGFVVTIPVISPTKKAADIIKKRGRPFKCNKAKQAPAVLRDVPRAIKAKKRDGRKNLFASPEKTFSENGHHVQMDFSEAYQENDPSLENQGTDWDWVPEVTETDSGLCKQGDKAARLGSDDNDTQSENEDDGQDEDEEDDEDHMAELMAASTTIRFAANRKEDSQALVRKRSKAAKTKDLTIAMLTPQLVEADPLKDERDTAFAQAYLSKVRDVLTPELHEKFLKLLYEFGCTNSSPIQLYQSVGILLSNYPDLVYDFSAFLLPEQALECGCYMANLEFEKVRKFLRKLEIHFGRKSSSYQRILKAFSQWQNHPDDNHDLLKGTIQPLLKGHPHLLEEFSLFFPGNKPPASAMTEFEELVLSGSDDEELLDPDGYEVVELPEDQENFGTKKCRCTCHTRAAETDIKLKKKKIHCKQCNIVRIIDGVLYLQTRGTNLKPARIIYHQSAKKNIKTPSPEKEAKQQEHPRNPVEVDTNMTKQLCDNPAIEFTVVDVPGGRISPPIQHPAEVPKMPPKIEMRMAHTKTKKRAQLITLSTIPPNKRVSSNKTQENETKHVQQSLDNSTQIIKGDNADGASDLNSTASSVLDLSQLASSNTDISLDQSFAKTSQSSIASIVDEESGSSSNMTDGSCKISPEKERIVLRINLGQSGGTTSVETVENAVVAWSREDDRVILETCKNDGPCQEAYDKIAKSIGRVTAQQVASRFQALMDIFASENTSEVPEESDEDSGSKVEQGSSL